MSSTRPTRPETIDIIPADEVGTLIEATDREFVGLERRATEARLAAEAAEASAHETGIDPKAATWSMVRLQRFLDTLRDEARRDATATVGVARHRAKVRVDDARAPTDGGESVAWLLPPEVQWSTPDPWGPPPPFAPSSPQPVSKELPPDPSATSDQQAVAMRAAPTNGSGGPGNAAGSAMVAALVAAPQVVPAQPPVEAAPVLDESFWGPEPPHTLTARRAPATTVDPVAPVVADPMTTARPSVVPSTVPPTAAPKVAPTKRSVLRRIPISAILEVIAVLLILVFILLRLS